MAGGLSGGVFGGGQPVVRWAVGAAWSAQPIGSAPSWRAARRCPAVTRALTGINASQVSIPALVLRNAIGTETANTAVESARSATARRCTVSTGRRRGSQLTSSARWTPLTAATVPA